MTVELSDHEIFAAADAVLASGLNVTPKRVREVLKRGNPVHIGAQLDRWWAQLMCGFHAIRTLSPPTSGHSFHAHSDRQSERSDAGLHC